MLALNRLYNEECLNGMDKLPDSCIDMVFCDLPYGTTNCSWDSVLDLKTLWRQYNRVVKDNGAVILTAAQPFTSVLILSNIKYFKYCWVWEKSKATGYLNSKSMPLRSHEDVCVFYRNPPVYNPQMVSGIPYNKGTALRETDVYGKQASTTVESKDGMRFPRTNLYFKTAESEGEVIHPTQKPVALIEYFIKTYSIKGDIVLDNCMGSGSTAIACLNLRRNYIGFELETKYYHKALKRLNKHQIPLFY